MKLEVRVPIDDATRTAIESAVSGFALLEELLRFGFASNPRRDLADVVIQDEYSHDVVMRWDERFVLVFEST